MTAIPAYAGIYIPYSYISPWASERHLATEQLASYFLVIFNAATLLGRLIPGIVADKVIGIVNMSLITLVILGMLFFCWMAVTGTGGAIVFTLVCGFWSGSAMSLLPLLPVVFTLDPALVGTGIGLASASAGIGVLFGSPVAGAMVKHGMDFTRLQAFAGGLSFGSAMALMGARMIRTGGRLIAKV